MPYRSAIIGVTLLVVVAGVAWTIWRSHSSAAAADAWYTIGPPLLQLDMNRLEKVATDDKGSPAGDWAVSPLRRFVLKPGGESTSGT